LKRPHREDEGDDSGEHGHAEKRDASAMQPTECDATKIVGGKAFERTADILPEAVDPRADHELGGRAGDNDEGS
jgi:hypothetical protein